MITGQNIADPEGVDELVIKKDSPFHVRKFKQHDSLEEIIIESNPRFGLLTPEEENAEIQNALQITNESDKIALGNILLFHCSNIMSIRKME